MLKVITLSKRLKTFGWIVIGAGGLSGAIIAKHPVNPVFGAIPAMIGAWGATMIETSEDLKEKNAEGDT